MNPFIHMGVKDVAFLMIWQLGALVAALAGIADPVVAYTVQNMVGLLGWFAWQLMQRSRQKKGLPPIAESPQPWWMQGAPPYPPTSMPPGADL